MKKLLLTALLCFSINGFAFNWKKVGENVNGSSYYVDVDSIKNHNGFLYYWALADWLEPNSVGTYSHIDKFKVDCGEEKQTYMSVTFYSQNMGKGRITSDSNYNEIEYPKPNSISYDVMKFACDRAK